MWNENLKQRPEYPSHLPSQRERNCATTRIIVKQIFIVGQGGPDKLQLRESADPTPARGEIRIRVKASGVNFADILARQGLYPDAPKLPCVIGYEVSGTVDGTGPGVDPSWIGRCLRADSLRRLFRPGDRARETGLRQTGF